MNIPSYKIKRSIFKARGTNFTTIDNGMRMKRREEVMRLLQFLYAAVITWHRERISQDMAIATRRTVTLFI